jgi:hypothetical protein
MKINYIFENMVQYDKGHLHLYDRTTSEMKGLSIKIISGDFR